MNNETLNIIITSVVVPVLVALTGIFVKYLNGLAENIKSKTSNEVTYQYIDLAESAISSSVVAVMQIFVETLKKNGTWNEDTQKEAFGMAKDRALAIMGTATKEVLNLVVDDVEQWIDTKIEQYVRLYK